MKKGFTLLFVVMLLVFSLSCQARYYTNHPVINDFLTKASVGGELKASKSLPYFIRLVKKGFCQQNKPCMVLMMGNRDKAKGVVFSIFALAYRYGKGGFKVDTGSYFPLMR